MTKQKIKDIADIVLEYALYGMLFFIPISIAAIEAMAGIAFTAFIVKKIIDPDFSFLKDHLYLVLLVFFFFNALSLMNSGPYLVKSLKALFFKWFEFMLIFMLASEGLNIRRRMRNMIIVAMFSVGLLSFDGIFQQLTGIDFIRKNLLSTTGYITAAFKNQNSYAPYLALMLLILLSLVSIPGLKIYRKAGLLVLIALSGTCLLLANCRGAWLGFLIGLLLYFILSRNYRISLIFFFIFMTAALLIPSVRVRIFNSLIYKGDGDRIALLRSTWAMIKDNPLLGKGLGTYMDYFPHYSTMKVTYYAHNSLMQMWAEAGIFTLLSFLVFVGMLFVRGVKAFNRNKDFVLLGVLCGLLAFMAHSLFDNHLYALQLRALFWFMSGVLLALIKTPFINKKKEE